MRSSKSSQEHNIAIDDLYTFIKPDLENFQNPKDVHFKSEGYDRLAEQVARSIDAAVPAK